MGALEACEPPGEALCCARLVAGDVRCEAAVGGADGTDD